MAENIPPEEYIKQLNHASDTIKHKIDQFPELTQPRVMIICGSGLGGIADVLQAEPKLEIPYSKIPGFKISTVPGHAGKLVFGLIGKESTSDVHGWSFTFLRRVQFPRNYFSR